jgi:hypothetical protein
MNEYFCPSDSDENIEYLVTGDEGFVEECNCPSRGLCKHLQKISRQIVHLRLLPGETAYHEVYEFIPSKSGRFQTDYDKNNEHWTIRGRTVTYRYLLPVRGFTRKGTIFKITDRSHRKDLRDMMIIEGIPKDIAYNHTRFL